MGNQNLDDVTLILLDVLFTVKLPSRLLYVFYIVCVPKCVYIQGLISTVLDAFSITSLSLNRENGGAISKSKSCRVCVRTEKEREREREGGRERREGGREREREGGRGREGEGGREGGREGRRQGTAVSGHLW